MPRDGMARTISEILQLGRNMRKAKVAAALKKHNSSPATLPKSPPKGGSAVRPPLGPIGPVGARGQTGVGSSTNRQTYPAVEPGQFILSMYPPVVRKKNDDSDQSAGSASSDRKSYENLWALSRVVAVSAHHCEVDRYFSSKSEEWISGWWGESDYEATVSLGQVRAVIDEDQADYALNALLKVKRQNSLVLENLIPVHGVIVKALANGDNTTIDNIINAHSRFMDQIEDSAKLYGTMFKLFSEGEGED